MYRSDKNLKNVKLRNDDEGQRNFFRKIFVHGKTDGYCGNIRVSFDMDGKAKLGEIGALSMLGMTPSCDQISSALALYRAVSLFECGIDKGQDFYKANWSVTVKHVPSEEYLVLGEWKGGFQIFTRFHSLDELPHGFAADVEDFLTYFVGNQITIGYDGTVAGTVA